MQQQRHGFRPQVYRRGRIQNAFALVGDRLVPASLAVAAKSADVCCRRHLWQHSARFPRGPFINFIFIFDGSSVVLRRGRSVQPAIVSKQENANEAHDPHDDHHPWFHDRARPNHHAAERRNDEQPPWIRSSRCVDVVVAIRLSVFVGNIVHRDRRFGNDDHKRLNGQRITDASRRQHQRNQRLLIAQCPGPSGVARRRAGHLNAVGQCDSGGFIEHLLDHVPPSDSLDGRRVGQHHGDRWFFGGRMLTGMGRAGARRAPRQHIARLARQSDRS